MRLDQRVRCSLRDHPRAADAVLAAALLPVILVARDPDRPPGSDSAPVATAVVMVLTCAALVVRRRWPVPVLAVTAAGAGSAVMLSGSHTLVVLATMVALYTVAARRDRRTTVLAWAGTAAALTTASLVHSRGFDFQALSYVGWTGMAAAVGDALRNRRAYVAAVEERAVRAEESREQEAHRRVVEERLRIARELHDVVAHRIAVVNVQAGVASHLLRSQPDAAEEALGHVREAGRAVLDEVADILSVLREPDDSPPPTAPAPSLAQLDELIASFSSAGLVVDWSLRGRPVDVGSAVGLVAYRLLQEALTNAHKHGTGTAHVLVAYGPSTVTLSVANPVRRPVRLVAGELPDPAGTGHGLLGMRERAAAVGGVVTASPDGDGLFHVEARLPVPSSSAA